MVYLYRCCATKLDRSICKCDIISGIFVPFSIHVKGKGCPYSITEHRVPELIVVLGSQPAGDVSHKPGGGLPLLSASPAVTLATLKRAATSEEGCYQFRCLVNRDTNHTMDVNSLRKTVTQQCRSCDLNPGPTAPESSRLTTEFIKWKLRCHS